jgi:hypothetical protein
MEPAILPRLEPISARHADRRLDRQLRAARFDRLLQMTQLLLQRFAGEAELAA